MKEGRGSCKKGYSGPATDLSKRLAAKHKERDRWLRLYAQDHISDAELESHLADLRAQLDNLKLLLE